MPVKKEKGTPAAEPKRPLGADEVNEGDRIDAMEARIIVLEGKLAGHLAYHFGKPMQDNK